MGNQIDTIREIIDGEAYTFAYLPPRIALSLLSKIIKLIGPSIGAIANDADDGEIDEKEINVGEAARLLCDRLDENEIMSMINTLLSQVTHEGKGDVIKSFDVIFTGRIRHLFSVVKKSLEVQYADFFDGKGVVEGLKGLAKNSPQAL